ncbi:Uncharacterised protein [uncultured archaeon]|nr:Uncharacterised protein [uncultured archaeon]
MAAGAWKTGADTVPSGVAGRNAPNVESTYVAESLGVSSGVKRALAASINPRSTLAGGFASGRAPGCTGGEGASEGGAETPSSTGTAGVPPLPVT